MKKLLLMLLSAAMILSLAACGNSGKTETEKEEAEYSIEVAGEKYSNEEFFGLNDLKKEELVGQKVIITGEISEITAGIRYSNIAEMDSSILIEVEKDASQYIIVDTSGLEESIKEWEEGDVVCVEANISYFLSDQLFFTRSEQTKDGISITNKTKGETVVNFEMAPLNDIDEETYAAIDAYLQSSEDDYWEYTDDYGVYYKIIFNNGNFKATMEIGGESMSNTGTYVIKDTAILITYDNGAQVKMDYIFENGELTYLGIMEEYVQ